MESKRLSYHSTGTSIDDTCLVNTRRLSPPEEKVKPAGLPKKLTKYVSKSTSTKKDLESELEEEEEATDNLLGRLRNGMRLIQSHARETMAQCDTDASRVDMAQRLESSHLKMMRAEKSFLSTTRLIAEVVDEFVSDYEDEPNDEAKGNGGVDEEGNGRAEVDKSGNVTSPEVKKSSLPVIFRPTMANSNSIRNFGSKLSKILDERQTKYNEGLTDDMLRREKKFRDLREQIDHGIEDAENAPKIVDITLYSGAGDMDMDTTDMHELEIQFASMPPMSETPTNLRFDSDDEDDYDESVLPSTDPISLKPIFTAVRNKFCNHVFDKASISQFMMQNPDAKCPMVGCRNDKPLSPDHLLFESKLTDRIRRKNSSYLM